MEKERKKKEKQPEVDIQSLVLTDEQKKAIMGIVANIQRMEMEKEAQKEDLEAVAQKLGVKAGVVSELANLVLKEQTKGGVVRGKKSMLELAEQILDSEAE